MSEFPDAEQARVTVDDGAAVTLLGWDKNCGDVGTVFQEGVEQYHKSMTL